MITGSPAPIASPRSIALKVSAALGALALALAAPAFGADPNGTVDWVGGVVTATGQGTASPKEQKTMARLKALRAAEVSAQRALLEVIKGVRIDSRTTVRNMLLEEDVINSRVEGFLKGAMVTRRDVEMVDGAPLATVEMKVCITGTAPECANQQHLVGVLDIDRQEDPPNAPAERFVLVLPQEEEPPYPAATSEQALSPPLQTAAPKEKRPVYDPTKPVTGVILNLEGRYFEREILPVVVTPCESSYKTVYSVKSVNPSIVRTYGAVRYAETLDYARQMQALGANPLILWVDTVTKDNMLVIRPQDAGLVRETISHGNNYLSEAKVAISNR